jgi:hypothetical protein
MKFTLISSKNMKDTNNLFHATRVLLETTQILSDVVPDELDNEGTISDGNVKPLTL